MSRTKTAKIDHPATASVAEMMAELDAIAAQHNIKWSAGERADITSAQRTRYATPGTRAGYGVVRHVSDKQVKYIKGLMAERDTSNLVLLPGAETIEHMSLTGARDLIERLLACPVKITHSAPVARPATEPMRRFVRSLVDQKGWGGFPEIDIASMTFDTAREMIETLKALPYASRPTTSKVNTDSVTEDGMYRTADGTIYKVQIAKLGSKNLYAKRLVIDTPVERDADNKIATPAQGHFEYAPGAIRKIRSTDKMSRDDAAEFGALYGMCMRCASDLTDETSIALGIGPVCRTKF